MSLAPQLTVSSAMEIAVKHRKGMATLVLPKSSGLFYALVPTDTSRIELIHHPSSIDLPEEERLIDYNVARRNGYIYHLTLSFFPDLVLYELCCGQEGVTEYHSIVTTKDGTYELTEHGAIPCPTIFGNKPSNHALATSHEQNSVYVSCPVM